MTAVLRTEGLTKSYGGRTVVRGVSLDVRAGEVVGLLGANGAGKTTTFSMVVGLVGPDAGRIVDAYGKKVLEKMPALVDETGSFTSSTLASRLTKSFDLMGGALALVRTEIDISRGQGEPVRFTHGGRTDDFYR